MSLLINISKLFIGLKVYGVSTCIIS